MARKILVVEDDRLIAKALSVRLRASGYEISVANDAITAVSLARKVEPDLVLLDISMPGGNGFSVADRLQTLLPVEPALIFLTASKNPEFQLQAQKFSPAAYFEKPYDADALLAAVKGALGE